MNLAERAAVDHSQAGTLLRLRHVVADGPHAERPSIMPVPAGTVERIQRYRDHLNQTQPGIEASASTAARMLLFRALEQVEVEMGIPKKASRSKGDLVHRKKT